MSDLKPIEPGCLCLVTGGDYRGATVTAIRYVGEAPDGVEPDGSCWHITPPISDEKYDWYASAVRLLRIDGHDEQETETSKRLEMVE